MAVKGRAWPTWSPLAGGIGELDQAEELLPSLVPGDGGEGLSSSHFCCHFFSMLAKSYFISFSSFL